MNSTMIRFVMFYIAIIQISHVFSKSLPRHDDVLNEIGHEFNPELSIVSDEHFRVKRSPVNGNIRGGGFGGSRGVFNNRTRQHSYRNRQRVRNNHRNTGISRPDPDQVVHFSDRLI